MKILIASSLYPPDIVGGVEIGAVALAEGFVERGHEVHVLAMALDGRERHERINGVEVRRLPILNFYTPFQGMHGPLSKLAWHAVDSLNLAMRGRLARYLAEIKPEVLQSHNLPGLSVAIWQAAQARGVPICQTLHDMYLLCPKTTMYRNGAICESACLDCRVLSAPKMKAARAVDSVIGVSQFVLSRHADFFRHVKDQRVIYNGCTFVDAAAPPVRRPRLTPLTLGYLGRLHETKGVGWLIKTLTHSEIGKRCRLIVAGRGTPDYEEKLRRESAGLNVEWRGFVEPSELLRDIDYLVVPSLWNEVAARTIQEALSLAVPVICSARGGMPEVAGDGGILFDPDDPEEFIGRLSALEGNTQAWEEMSSRARLHARRFSVAAMIEQHLKALEDTVDAKRAAR